VEGCVGDTHGTRYDESTLDVPDDVSNCPNSTSVWLRRPPRSPRSPRSPRPLLLLLLLCFLVTNMDCPALSLSAISDGTIEALFWEWSEGRTRLQRRGENGERSVAYGRV
jgi:hypothetical protein